ncbi:hypothetical protein [Sphingopyxis witflariensis]|uniref:Uncharacterized protein n=1 Tax=Sphingopyxis witflariensis TaxID=173675 RepID=A0A2D0AMW8_9SPHN|nr:hypothetical protein [Sphingopyxis witflariensis]OWQ95100.1 hypothetical protein CDQ91_14355 [Sphingopyxis witflariensis]
MTPLDGAAKALHKKLREYRPDREQEDPLDPPAVQQAPLAEWETLPKEAHDHYRELVLLVLKAIREPNDFMRQAGGGALAEAVGNDPDEPLDVIVEQALMIPFDEEADFDPARDKLADHAIKVWQAMIDDAMDDGQ